MKLKNIFLTTICSVSIVLSIVAICRCCPRSGGLDYLGCIVGILALLVTALIGWQIFNIVSIERYVSDAIDKKLEVIKYCIPMELSDSFADEVLKSFLPRLESRMKGLESGIRSNNPSVLDRSFEEAYRFLTDVSVQQEPIPKETQECYLRLVCKADHPKRDMVLELIASLKSK